MDFSLDETHEDIRAGVRTLCSKFPDEYWMERDDQHEFPWDFYNAVAAESEAGEDEVMAYVVANAPVDAAELWAWCEGRIPGFAVPRFIRIVGELPKTPSEKVQKAQLRALGITADTADRLAQAAVGAR